MNYPIVYSKFETEFVSMGLAVLENASNTKIREVINGEFILSLILPRSDSKWQHLQEENYIKVDNKLFRIRTFDETRDSVGKLTSNIQCEHVWYDANDCKFIPNFEMIGVTPEAILQAAFADTRFTVGSVDASLADTDIMMSKTNPAAITNKLIENVGGELVRDNWIIHLKARRGNYNGVQFRTGKNNADIKKMTDTRGLTTRLYPYGVDDLDITTVNDGDAYLDSPYINNYDYDHTRHIDYRDIEDPAELKAKALKEFSTADKDGIDKPLITYQVGVVELKKLADYRFETFDLGDTARVVDEDLNVDVNARIMEYDYYPYEPIRSTVVLANFKNNIGNLFVKLSETRSQVNSLLTPQGKVKAAWLENIIAKLQTEVELGLLKKVVMHDYGDVWVDSIENPTKAMAIVNGMFAIANSKKENGDWDWRTFGNGDGFTADLINAGKIRLSESLTVENDDGNVTLNSSGFKIVKADKKARALYYADTISLQSGDGLGNYVDRIYYDTVLGKYVIDGVLSAEAIEAIKANIEIIISDTFITQSLSATKGYIADLTVDQLETSTKVKNYLANSTADVNYIKIYEQYVQFITASTDGLLTVQAADRYGQPLYWTDDTHTAATVTVTDYPVTIFKYTELTKLEQTFENDGVNYIPKMILGAGSGLVEHPDYGKGYMYKGATGLYIEYLHSVTGLSRIIKLTDEGIDLTDFEAIKYSETVAITGLPQIWVQTEVPDAAKTKDIWVDTDDYSRYDIFPLAVGATLAMGSNEMITATGTFTITLHAATSAGIIKKIYNIGTGIITIAGTINGVADMLLYPKESIELITDGIGWRY
ncbi:MAG TPA: phage tail protein [Methanosarcinales archaeon]|nr:phage tail protein [Methanosarcinales archaeon]